MVSNALFNCRQQLLMEFLIGAALAVRQRLQSV